MTDSNSQLEDLERRLHRVEQALLPSEEDRQLEDTSKLKNNDSLSRRVKEMSRETNDLFRREKNLLKYEQKTTQLNEWLKTEKASVSDMVLHQCAKRNFILTNADYLRRFASDLEELKGLEASISPPSPHIPELEKDKLDNLENNQKPMRLFWSSVYMILFAALFIWPGVFSDPFRH